MSSNNFPDKTTRSNIDIRYDEVKKLMQDLCDASNNFNSVILTQDQIPENITITSSDQKNKPINNSESISTANINPQWGFIQEKDLDDEKEKLLKHVAI